MVNFESRTYCEEIGQAAWGYIEYKYPLHPDDVEEYELSVIPSKIKEVVFVGLDDFGHRTYKDRDGKKGGVHSKILVCDNFHNRQRARGCKYHECN